MDPCSLIINTLLRAKLTCSGYTCTYGIVWATREKLGERFFLPWYPPYRQIQIPPLAYSSALSLPIQHASVYKAFFPWRQPTTGMRRWHIRIYSFNHVEWKWLSRAYLSAVPCREGRKSQPFLWLSSNCCKQTPYLFCDGGSLCNQRGIVFSDTQKK